MTACSHWATTTVVSRKEADEGLQISSLASVTVCSIGGEL